MGVTPLNVALWLGRHGSDDSIFLGEDPDGRLSPFRELKKSVEASGGWCHTQDVCLRQGLIPDAVVFLDVPEKPAARLLGDWEGKVRKYALLQECEVVVPRNWEIERHSQFDAIFTWSPSLVDGRRYFRVNFSNPFPRESIPQAADKKFCVMISANKKNNHPLELYSEREKTIRWFEANHPEDFDLYGIGWDRYVFRGAKAVRALNRLPLLPRLIGGNFPSYRGAVELKRPVLAGYKFTICYENARDIPGYITEKVFDALFSGSVPVYWGAPDIADNVDRECFIDRRDFKTHEELYAYMKSMPDVRRQGMVEAGKAYLKTEKAYRFSDRYFAEELTRVIRG